MNTLKKTVQTIGPAFFGIVLTVAGFDPIFYIAAVAAAGYSLVLLVWLPADA